MPHPGPVGQLSASPNTSRGLQALLWVLYDHPLLVVIPNRQPIPNLLICCFGSKAMKIAAEQIIGSRLGKEFSDQEATKLAELMDMRELHANEYLISEGTEDDSLHVLLEGHLEVVKQTTGNSIASIAVVREGDLAGELSFLDGDAHTVGLRALGECRVISLKKEEFEKIVVDDPQLAYKVMRAIARSSHRIMHQMNHDFIELNNYIFKQHGRY